MSASGDTRPLTGLRAKLRGRRASHSHGVVLGLVVVSFLFAATAPDDAWAASVLVLIQTATLVAALWTWGLQAPAPSSA